MPVSNDSVGLKTVRTDFKPALKCRFEMFAGLKRCSTMSITFEVAKANEAALQKQFEDTEFRPTGIRNRHPVGAGF